MQQWDLVDSDVFSHGASYWFVEKFLTVFGMTLYFINVFFSSFRVVNWQLQYELIWTDDTQCIGEKARLGLKTELLKRCKNNKRLNMSSSDILKLY